MSGQKKNTTTKKSVKEDTKHIQVLLKHRHHYELFIRTGELVNFSAETQTELFNIYKERKPNYDYNRRCAACVAEFLVHVYSEFKNEL